MEEIGLVLIWILSGKQSVDFPAILTPKGILAAVVPGGHIIRAQVHGQLGRVGAPLKSVLGGSPSHQHRHAILQLLASHQEAILGGALDGVAQGTDAARDDRDLVHRVGALEQLGHHGRHVGKFQKGLVDHLLGLGRGCSHVEDVPGNDEAFYAFIAYPIDLFEEGSVVNVFTSLVGNVFGFKAVRALRLEDVRFPIAYVKTCGGPPLGIQVERDVMNKYGRPLLGCTIKPKLGLSAKNYGRAVYECLRGGLDFTKDDENVNSQPFMRWRQRFDFVMEAILKSEAETGERKGHYLNVTAPTPDEMFKRAEYAKEIGAPIIMHDYITGGFCANTGLANWCRDNGMLLHIHRAMHAVIDRNPHHGIHFRVLTKILRLSGGDHLHTGTVVGKLEGDRASTLGWIDRLRDTKTLSLLDRFDHVVISHEALVGPLSALIRPSCSYQSFGVDALRFCPYPSPPPRSIDFYALGRRSPVAHRELYERANGAPGFTAKRERPSRRKFSAGRSSQRRYKPASGRVR